MTPRPVAQAAAEVNKKRAIATKLTVVARQLWQRFDRSVELIGVSRAKWRLIAVVASHPGATQRLIAEVLEVSEVTAGRLVDRLCAEGYLERRENPTDRRAHCICLMPPSRPILARLGEVANNEEEEAFAGLDEEDLDKFVFLLEAVAQNIAGARGDRARALPKLGGRLYAEEVFNERDDPSGTSASDEICRITSARPG